MTPATNRLLAIDGAQGEGGGQVLRSSLTLALLTGRGFRITRIRAGRRKSGLLRQHLTAVRAAAEVGQAEVIGAAPGSQELEFRPGAVRSGEFEYAIGTAGSCTLVLQTILLPLLLAAGPSRVRLSGGTHNPQAPPVDFLQQAFLPLLERIGARARLQLLRHGFYPAGGGQLELQVEPAAQLQPLELSTRGPLREVRAEALIAGLPPHIARRELTTLSRTLGWGEDRLGVRELPKAVGPGNALVLSLQYERLAEVFTGFGEFGVSAEKVAGRLCRMVRSYQAGRGAVGPYLADQLLLPLSLASGRFSTERPTQHTLTNLAVIERFLPGRLRMRTQDADLVMIEGGNQPLRT